MMTHTGSIPTFTADSALYRPPQHFFRTGLGRFATGVAVVTFDAADGSRRGITINSFTSISMDPPLVLASIGRHARSHDALADRPFTVNILGAESQALALQFAGKPSLEPRFVEGDVAPRLEGALGWFECTPWAAYDGGDHTMYLGEVAHHGSRRGDALGFLGGQFVTIPEAVAGHEDLF